MSLQGWEDLACDKCGGKYFRQLVNLQFKDGQGTTTKPAGYECQNCNARADMGKLINNIRQKNLKRQIEELKAQSG